MSAPEMLVRPETGSVEVIRPMFEVLPDSGQHCNCHFLRTRDKVCGPGMNVPASEYARPDRIFL